MRKGIAAAAVLVLTAMIAVVVPTRRRTPARLYEDVNRGYGHACLYPDELYADDLRDEPFHNGYGVDNRISSHEWVAGGRLYGAA